jgi:hypothetical protein
MKQQQMKTLPKDKPMTDDEIGLEKEFDRVLSVLEKRICGMFLKAVKEHDRDKIVEIADAVWYFRGKITLATPVKKDPIRDALLALRDVVRVCPMNTKTAVSFVEYITKMKIPGSESGYSDFKKICREIGFQLEDSRKTRKN